jgi:glyoxylase-like metal-dependent hydrolase (beta-lactamase superfamily II)
MYVFDCGEAQIPDVSPWSPGVNVGKPAVFSNNCYLIAHGNDLMLWDSGYSDLIAVMAGGMVGPRSTAVVKKTLAAQMAELNIKPEQITRIAFSHTHMDHVGNANMFASATLYIQQAEYDAAFGADPAKFGFVATSYDKLRASPSVKLSGDYDIFGDGSVLILSTPGHTPGHQSLLVRLPKTGVVVLTGDAAHFKENFDNRRVPAFNFNKEQTVQSMDKLARIAAAEHAQLWFNHDRAQSSGIPHSPQFLN